MMLTVFGIISKYIIAWRDVLVTKGISIKIWSKRDIIMDRRNKLICHICKNVNGNLQWLNDYYSSKEYIYLAKIMMKVWANEQVLGSTNWNKAVHLVALYTLLIYDEMDFKSDNYSCLKEAIMDQAWLEFCDHQLYFEKTEFKCSYFEAYSTDEDTCESIYEKMEMVSFDDESMDAIMLVFI